MNNLKFLFLILTAFSCSEKKADLHTSREDQYVPAAYDTTAVDSFSTGATSVDVAARIRLSSRNYQDSLLLIRKKNEAEKLSKELAEKQRAAGEKKKDLTTKKVEDPKPADKIPEERVKNP